jgi:CBS domain-containing protein
MKVASILKSKGVHVETCRPETTVYSAVWTLKLKGIGALVVRDESGAVLGVISERDIVHGLAEHGPGLMSLPVSRLMSTHVLKCTPDDSITAVMAQMTRYRVRHLPVVDRDELCGIVSIGDVVKYRLDEMALEANILRETLMTSH